MSKIHNALTATFDLEPEKIVTGKDELQVIPPDDSGIDEDAAAVRETLYELLKQGSEAFEDLKRIAVAEESPRSFEVLNGMLANLSDIATKIMDVHERKARVKKAQAVQQPIPQQVNNGTVMNNNVFVGTTAQLQEMLKNLDRGDVSDSTIA